MQKLDKLYSELTVEEIIDYHRELVGSNLSKEEKENEIQKLEGALSSSEKIPYLCAAVREMRDRYIWMLWEALQQQLGKEMAEFKWNCGLLSVYETFPHEYKDKIVASFAFSLAELISLISAICEDKTIQDEFFRQSDKEELFDYYIKKNNLSPLLERAQKIINEKKNESKFGRMMEKKQKEIMQEYLGAIYGHPDSEK